MALKVNPLGDPSGAKARGVSLNPGDIFPVMGGAMVDEPVRFEALVSFNEFKRGGVYSASVSRVNRWVQDGLASLEAREAKPEEPSESTAEAGPSEAKTLEDRTVKELREMASEMGISGYGGLRKADLIAAIEAEG